MAEIAPVADANADEALKGYSEALDMINAERHAEALVLLAKLVEKFPKFPAAIVLRGFLFFKMGRVDRARACYESVLEMVPDHAEALTNLAALDIEEGNPAQAVERLLIAARQSPHRTDIQSNLGVALHDAGDFQAARRHFEQALSLDATDAHARAYLANLILDSDDHNGRRWLNDFDALIDVSTVAAPEGWDNVASFLGDLETALKGEASMQDSPAHRSTVGGASSRPLQTTDATALGALRRRIVEAADSYVRRHLSGDDLPLLGRRPPSVSISMWGNILKSAGHQTTHNHPSGWLSGVFYVKVPEPILNGGNGQDGWIEFGRPRAEYGNADQLDLRLFRPRPGMLIVFPSYLWHRTLPFESEQTRISIAFDVVAG